MPHVMCLPFAAAMVTLGLTTTQRHPPFPGLPLASRHVPQQWPLRLLPVRKPCSEAPVQNGLCDGGPCAGHISMWRHKR